MKYSDRFDDDFNRIKSYVGEALGKAYEQNQDLERRVEVLLFRLQEIADSDLIASNLKSMAKHAIKEFGNIK